MQQNLTYFCLIKLVWSNFEKREQVLIYQLDLMKYDQSKLKCQRVKKNCENKTTNK